MSEEMRNGEALSPASPVLPHCGGEAGEDEVQIVAAVVRQIMAPVMESIGAILERNSQAMERIAASQQMMSARISELEKQVRLKTPMSRTQENYVNGAVRAKARELLEARGVVDDRKAVTRLGGMIRKSVLQRYGVSTLREAPAYDYETVLDQVRFWNDLPAIREVIREAEARKASECGSDEA